MTASEIIEHAVNNDWDIRTLLKELRENGYYPDDHEDLDGNTRWVIGDICFWSPYKTASIFVIPADWFLKDD